MRLPLAPPATAEPQGAAGTSGADGPMQQVASALSALKKSALSTLGQMLELQQALLARSEAVTQLLEPHAQSQLLAGGEWHSAPPRNSDVSSAHLLIFLVYYMVHLANSLVQTCWSRLDVLHEASSDFRSSSLDKWHRRTVMMGLGALKGGPATQLKAINQSISAQASRCAVALEVGVRWI